MSNVIEIYPSKSYIPTYKEIINHVMDLLIELTSFCENSNFHLSIIDENGNTNIESNEIIRSEDNYVTFHIENQGELYLFYYSMKEIDYECWTDEMKYNQNAKKIQDKINSNFEKGYFWSIKKTAGQPRIAEILQIMIAMSISKYTDGYLYSDDGTIDYSLVPILETELFSKIKKSGFTSV